MADHTFRARPVFAWLTGLDFGLRVRVEAHPLQQPIFEGAENFSAASLASELAEEVSRLRVHSYSMRAQLEHVTTALLANVQCRSWRYARRASLDLAGLLALARKRRLVDASRAIRGANCALHLADLLGREVR